jgi:hypothetical protein
VFLLPDRVSLAKPVGDFVVDLVRSAERELVDLVARRWSPDLREAWTVAPACEHHMASQLVLPQRESGEAHADLKRDACLLGQHFDRAVAPRRGDQGAIRGDDLWITTVEMLSQPVTAASMRLVSVGELSPALEASP